MSFYFKSGIFINPTSVQFSFFSSIFQRNDQLIVYRFFPVGKFALLCQATVDDAIKNTNIKSNESHEGNECLHKANLQNIIVKFCNHISVIYNVVIQYTRVINSMKLITADLTLAKSPLFYSTDHICYDGGQL